MISRLYRDSVGGQGLILGPFIYHWIKSQSLNWEIQVTHQRIKTQKHTRITTTWHPWGITFYLSGNYNRSSSTCVGCMEYLCLINPPGRSSPVQKLSQMVIDHSIRLFPNKCHLLRSIHLCVLEGTNNKSGAIRRYTSNWGLILTLICQLNRELHID